MQTKDHYLERRRHGRFQKMRQALKMHCDIYVEKEAPIHKEKSLILRRMSKCPSNLKVVCIPGT